MSIIPTMDSSSTLSGFDPNSGSLAGDSVNTGDNSAASIIRRKNILQSNSLLGNLSAFCQKAISVETPVLSSIGVSLSKLQNLDITKFRNKHEYRKLLEEGFAATYISAKITGDENINSKYVESNSNFGLFSRDSKHPVNRWMPIAALNRVNDGIKISVNGVFYYQASFVTGNAAPPDTLPEDTYARNASTPFQMERVNTSVSVYIQVFHFKYPLLSVQDVLNFGLPLSDPLDYVCRDVSRSSFLQFGNDCTKQDAWEGKTIFKNFEDKVVYHDSSLSNVNAAVNVSCIPLSFDFPFKYYDKETDSLQGYQNGDQIFLYVMLSISARTEFSVDINVIKDSLVVFQSDPESSSPSEFLAIQHPEITTQDVSEYREQFKNAEYTTRKNEIKYNALLKFSPSQLPSLCVDIDNQPTPQDTKDVRVISSKEANPVTYGLLNPLVVEDPIESQKPLETEPQKKRQSFYTLPSPTKDLSFTRGYQGAVKVAGEYGDANDPNKLTHLTEIQSDAFLKSNSNSITFTCFDTQVTQIDYTPNGRIQT
jgi:hypothetical protein